MKFSDIGDLTEQFQSPSMRREWIEMHCQRQQGQPERSPSMRREWIEMMSLPELPPLQAVLLSPSMRREWIEMCWSGDTAISK